MSRPNFIPSKVMDFSSKIRSVIAEFDCGRHNAPVGIPCFHLRMDSREGYYAGICNVRATKLFNGLPTKLRSGVNVPNSHLKKEKR